MTEKIIPAWLAKIIGCDCRELKDKEYNQIWTLLRLIEPVSSSNNQRSWTDEYELNGKKYNVTYGLEDKPIIEEITK